MPAINKNDWIELWSGTRLNPLLMRPEDVRLDDIARGLSLSCRFGGHIREFYSVAQHCVIMSQQCPRELALECLMHDAAEAYLSDIPRPVKHQIAGWDKIEARVEMVIRRGLHMPGDHHPEAVREWDDRMLVTEARDLGKSWWNTDKWGSIEPLDIRIEGWDWRFAEQQFLQRYADLTRGPL